ncbi:O-antigen ligase family protein [Sphingomonas sp. CROZ-RG-20F-R02-07]|uniref:O-antigen ligase family protein n=1 Tax=Sphingomonas sp. CROZ-RG-20F-R02-07 TaxID=2914832 RepID=UPI001F55F3B6|nr:O-antigen ligase family protein [Sphingomonas sp. CROZ-RG-20F-R02-07]
MNRHAVVPAYLLLCLLLGGASAAGFIANLFLELAAIPLIGWSLWQLLQGAPVRPIRAPLALLALLVALMLVQLIPLPPALWTLLPGRGWIVDDYRLLGLPLPWLPLTLAPDGALSSLLWLLPAFAVFLAIVVLGAFRGRLIAWIIVAVTLASVAVGALQIIGGESGGAYFYENTNPGVAVGFFANGNHNATLLLVCIPFLAALQGALLKRSRSQRSASAVRLLIGAAYAIILVGLLINASLAGIGLGVPVTLGTWLVFGRQPAMLRRGLAILTVLASVAALGAIVVGPFGNNLFGIQQKNVELSRQTSFTLTLRAALTYLPFGSGIGSFQPVYHTQEPLPSVGTTYMNHAHSDWIEIFLETGIVGIGLAVLFLIWWARRIRAIWQAEERDGFAQAATIASAAIMLHSLVDYPLRTAALSAIFAACVGLMTGMRPHVRRSRTASSARHLSL